MNDPNDRDEPHPPLPDGNAQHRRPDNDYGAAGGEDSSPFENVPSGEKADAARQPQNAEPGKK
jgi:hypothetical protein